MAIKVCLEFITMCCIMSDVRVDAGDSALQYLFTNSKDNDFQSNLFFWSHNEYKITFSIKEEVNVSV